MFYFNTFKNVTYVIVTYHTLSVAYVFWDKILHLFEIDQNEKISKKYLKIFIMKFTYFHNWKYSNCNSTVI